MYHVSAQGFDERMLNIHYDDDDDDYYYSILTPTLPKTVKFPGSKIHGHTCKQYIFRSFNTFTFNAMHFDENPFMYQCEKDDKQAEGSQILHLYSSFSSDVMTVKG